MRQDLLRALNNRGIFPQPYAEMAKPEWQLDGQLAHDEISALAAQHGLGMDALPSLITTQNAGIPAFMANLLDPKTVRVLLTPMNAATIAGETKKGSWTTITMQFPMSEPTGEVASYGDYSETGSVGTNYNWVPRQSYHYQTITQYGDRETEMFGLAEMNYVADLNSASALLLNKFQNQSYFFGIAGIPNYGLLNDPALLAPIQPGTKTAGGTAWAAATAVEVYNDVLALYTQLNEQLMGLIDRDTPMTLAMSNVVEPNLGKVTSYTLAPVREAIKSNWKNLKIVTAPEYNTAGGELMQLIVDEMDGDKTVVCAFTEKLRAGRVVPELSSFKQKKIGGTWGCIVKRPVAIASMIGL